MVAVSASGRSRGSSKGRRSGAAGPRATQAIRRGPKGRPGVKAAGASHGEAWGAASDQRPVRSRADIKRRMIRAGISFLVLGLLVGGLYFFGTRPRGESAQAAALAARAAQAAPTAGCSGVRVIRPYSGDLDRAHVGGELPALPPLSSYPSVPPASGPHDPTPLDAGAYTTAPPIGQAIHSLEHGAVIIWFAPTAATAARPVARFFAQPDNTDHVISAPYDYPSVGAAGRLPQGVGMVLVAWHRMQTCRDPSLPVAAAFVKRYAAPGRFIPLGRPRGYVGDAPEAGYSI
jgi:hypothetical protein